MKIIKDQNNLIKFKKGASWEFSIAPEKIEINGKIIFEKDNNTIIKIFYERNLFNFMMGLCIFIGVFCIVLPYILSIFLKGFIDHSYSMQIFGFAYLIIVLILFSKMGDSLNKGEKKFVNKIFDFLEKIPEEKKEIGIVEGKYLDKCPICNAPLFKRTPVKCEYCGILIEN